MDLSTVKAPIGPRSNEPSRVVGVARRLRRGQIPWAGWKDILWRAYEQISEDRLLAVAAGVVFYGLLALFPAITALVSLYGLFAKSSTISEHLALLRDVVPAGGLDIIQDQMNRLAEKGDARLSLTFAFGLGLALGALMPV